MLKGSNNDKLLTIGVDEKYLVFYQRWQELLDKRTLDIHQYKIMNSFVAIDELISIINLSLTGVHTTDYNVRNCIQETSLIIDEDYVISKYFSTLVIPTRAQLKCLNKEKLSSQEKYKLMFHLQYVLKRLSLSYLNQSLEELFAAISDSNYEVMNKCMYIIISQCIYNGWSTQGLLELLRFFVGEKSFSEKWNQFTYIISLGKVYHEVYISIALKQNNSSAGTDSLKSLGFTVHNKEEIEELYKDKCSIDRELSSDKRYVSVCTQATDLVSAARQGICDIAEKMDIASFYNIIYPWDTKSVSIIVINTTSWFVRDFTGEELYQTYDYIDSSNDIFLNTQVIFSNADKRGIQNRLRGAFTYANISRNSFFQEEKYLNMWVALESLSQSSMYNSDIENVKEFAASALCLRYLYKLVRNFYEDCKRCKVNFTFSSISYNFADRSNKEIVITMISILKDKTLADELKSKCNNNHLLKYRCDEVTVLLNDRKNIYKKIQKHNQRIRWQLQRLYRLRNEIAHSALHQSSSLVIYIEHLYDYLACFITEITMCHDMENINTIEEIYSILKDNYYIFETEINKEESDLIDNFYSSGIMDFI